MVVSFLLLGLVNGSSGSSGGGGHDGNNHGRDSSSCCGDSSIVVMVVMPIGRCVVMVIAGMPGGCPVIVVKVVVQLMLIIRMIGDGGDGDNRNSRM